MRPAVLLDRDGAITEVVTHLDRFERLISIDAVGLLDCDLRAAGPATLAPASAHARAVRRVCARF